MADFAATFGIICAAAITVTACFAVITVCVARIYADAERYRNTDENDRAYAAINLADRWLSYEWPIVEDVAEHLRNAMNDTAHENMSDFRDRMRRKYAKEESRS